jgi:hypothetical protein
MRRKFIYLAGVSILLAVILLIEGINKAEMQTPSGIGEKVDLLLQKQDQVLQKLNEIAEELHKIKIRVSRIRTQ